MLGIERRGARTGRRPPTRKSKQMPCERMALHPPSLEKVANLHMQSES